MKSLATMPITAAMFAAIAFAKSGAVASTITDPGVIIEVVAGTNILTWDAAIAGPADVEHSDSLSGWTKVSTNNSTGAFRHSAESATRGFYRLRWTPGTRPITPTMITVQGGTLPQSSQLARATVQTFQIGKYEVTWDEWQEVRAWAVENGYADLSATNLSHRRPPGLGSAPNHPVRDVSWYDAVKWCNAKSERNGLAPVYRVAGAIYRAGTNSPSISRGADGYRLPTEAEWEWAARGGANSAGYVYSGGNDLNAVAWFYENSTGAVLDLFSGRGTWPAGVKIANELAVYDMSGNVGEWVFSSSDIIGQRCWRGGSYLSTSLFCTVRARTFIPASDRCLDVGLRVARNAP